MAVKKKCCRQPRQQNSAQQNLQINVPTTLAEREVIVSMIKQRVSSASVVAWIHVKMEESANQMEMRISPATAQLDGADQRAVTMSMNARTRRTSANMVIVKIPTEATCAIAIQDMMEMTVRFGRAAP